MKKTCKTILAIFLLVTGILINPFLSYAGNDTETTDPGNLYALSAVLMDGTSGRVLYGKNVLVTGILINPFLSYAGNDTETTDPGNLYALSAVLMDGTSGRVLYGKNATEPRAMASTTKIMTCILILEQGNLEDIATASGYAASMPKVHLGAAEGETFYVKDLLYSLMLESHNDSAVILAEYLGGNVSGFAAKMNEKAREIGCTDTWFITPNGLDAQEEVQGEVGRNIWQGIVRKKRNRAQSHGQHHEDYDVYPDFGAGESGGHSHGFWLCSFHAKSPFGCSRRRNILCERSAIFPHAGKSQ